jgi:predicted ATP-grasp superfamily ATP-dependent carboligase
VREYPRRNGTTASSVGIPLGEVAEAVDAVKRMLADISYRGFFNIEFKRDARDGHYKVIEFNPRPCWYTGTIASGGVDLPWLAYLDALELPVPDAPGYPAGRYALYEAGDAKAILGALKSGERPHGSIARTWLTGDRALFWWTDPMPALGGAWLALGRRIGRLTGRSRRAPTASSRSA